MNIFKFAAAVLASLVLSIGGALHATAQDSRVTAQGEALARVLDSMDVEAKWPAGVHVNWETGVPDGKPVSEHGKHTHCSAFVASTAKRLGVYILRPPQHGQELLANAQNEWLPVEGAREGWRPLKSMAEAQDAANHGELVVASYHNHRDNKPGHIAIVRPSAKSLHALAVDGPDIIQAGTVNKNQTTAREGFSGHPAAWRDNEIEYYEHDIALH